MAAERMEDGVSEGKPQCPEEANRWPRITQPVLKRPRHVHCHLCCPDGHMQHAVITARRHGRCGGTNSALSPLALVHSAAQMPKDGI